MTDDDGNSLYAIWSRSGNRLIVTAESGTRQVLLSRDQVAELADFIERTSGE